MRNPFRRRPSLEEVLKMQRGLIIEKTTDSGGDPTWAISFDAVEMVDWDGAYYYQSKPRRVQLAVSDIGLATVSDKSLTGDTL